jgi:hypothetical protein
MKYLLSISLLSLLLGSCEPDSPKNDSPFPFAKGNGDVIVSKRTVPDFNRISLKGAFNVLIRQGEPALTVETDANLQELVICQVNNGMLEVTMKKEVKVLNNKKLQITISVKELRELYSECVGTVRSENIKMPAMLVSVRSVGNTDLDLDVKRLVVDADIVGTVTLKGTAGEARISHNGVGGINAFLLKAETLHLKATGIGTAQVTASNELDVIAEGIGEVIYRGEPSRKTLKKTGLGNIRQEELPD